jgi:hypothetical protein
MKGYLLTPTAQDGLVGIRDYYGIGGGGGAGGGEAGSQM